MNRGAALGALTRYTLSRLLAPGRLLVTLGIFAFPVLWAIGASLFGKAPVNLLAGGLYVYFNLYIVLIAASLFNALAVTSQELEDGSALYLYSGILPRWIVLLDRFAVVAGLLTLISGLSITATYLFLKPNGLTLDAGQIVTLAGISGAGLALFTAAYMACGAWFKHSMAASIVLTVLWEVVVFGTPTQLWPYTVTCCMRSLVKAEVYGGAPPGWLLRVSDLNRARGIEMLAPREALIYLGILCASLLVLGAWAISRRQLTDKAASE